jgi:uncharacterized protein YdhG (YjbR/CyaY superfamily)
MKPKHETVDEALAAAPSEARSLLKKIRTLALKAAKAGAAMGLVEERISYGMPTVFINGRVLLYYAAFKDHVGVFPPPHGDAAFMKMIAPYAGPKGNLSFPYGAKVPDSLLKAVIDTRLAAARDPKTTKVKAKVKAKAKADSKTSSTIKVGSIRARTKSTSQTAPKEGKPDSFARRTRWPMPVLVKRSLQEAGLEKAYRERPPYQRNDYIGWIIHAKTPATQMKRLAQMLEELERGGVYMKMKHAASARQKD